MSSFRDNDTYIFFQAQWFPRMAAYTDYTGWQHKQFLGRGEFTLEFGNYDVSITVPADHIVGATGVLQNPNEVLTARAAQPPGAGTQREVDKPMYIVTPDEALANEKEGTTATKTWRWKAENVRDFAWASSRKFIWDAMGVDQPVGRRRAGAVLLPERGRSAVVAVLDAGGGAHDRRLFAVSPSRTPIRLRLSVNTWLSGGMEYPMISFNGYRPVKDEKTARRPTPAAPSTA